MNILEAKVVVILGLALVTATLGLLPYLVKVYMAKKNRLTDDGHQQKPKLTISLMLCFGGGVLFATCCTHMLPDIVADFDDLGSAGQIWRPTLPWAEMCMCSGFFLIYLLEEVVHSLVHSRNHGDTSKEYVDIHDTMSSRRCSSVSVVTKEESDKNKCALNDLNFEFGSKAELVSNDQGRLSIQITPKKDSGHSHHHHHPEGTDMSFLRHLMTVMALSFHAIFEGLAVGLQRSQGEVWYLFGAIASHKFVLAFCVGTELATSTIRTALLVTSIVVFAVMSPLGILIGIVITDCSVVEGALISSLQGIAAGTLLYVVFFEVLQRERTKFEHHGILQLTAVFIGFFLMTVLSEALNDEVGDVDVATTTAFNFTTPSSAMNLTTTSH